MKNGDTPAVFVPWDDFCGSQNGCFVGNLGLTKREAFAMAAMQGFATSLAKEETASDAKIALFSVALADALLAALEAE